MLLAAAYMVLLIYHNVGVTQQVKKKNVVTDPTTRQNLVAAGCLVFCKIVRRE